MKKSTKTIGIICNVFSRLTIGGTMFTAICALVTVGSAVLWDVAEKRERNNNFKNN